MSTELWGELDGAQWGAWKHNPITEAFFAYLADWKANEERWILHAFMAGGFTDTSPDASRNPHVMRGQVLALQHVMQIDYRAIRDWYAEKAEEEANAVDDRGNAGADEPDRAA